MMDLVKTAEESGKDLDDSIGISFSLAIGHCIVIGKLLSLRMESPS